MMNFLGPTGAILQSSTIEVQPWARDALDRFAQTHAAIPSVHIELEQALYEASGKRGLPVLHGHVFGLLTAARESGAPLWIDVPSAKERNEAKAFLMAWSRRQELPLYMSSDGRVLLGSGLVMEEDVVRFIERLALFSDPRWLPMRIECRVGHRGGDIASALSLPPFPSSIKSASMWLNTNVLLVDEPINTSWIRVASFDALERVLAACQDLKIPLQVISDWPARIVLEEGSAASTEIELGAQYCLTGEPVRIIKLDREISSIREVWARCGRIFEARTLDREEMIIRRYDRAAAHLASHISPRVVRWLDAQRMFRDASSTCSSEALLADCERYGVPSWPSLLNFEALLGGLAAYDPVDPAYVPASETRLGVHRVLHEKLGMDDEDADDSLFLKPGPWPIVHLDGRPLVLVGKLLGSAHLYLGESGAIFSFLYEFDQLTICADNALRYLEKLALQWEMRGMIPDWTPVEVTEDVGAALADRLDLLQFEEASDSVSAHWAKDGIWIWRAQTLRPDEPACVNTFISTRIGEKMVEAVRRAKERAPTARLRVHSSKGPQRYLELKAAGFDVERV